MLRQEKGESLKKEEKEEIHQTHQISIHNISIGHDIKSRNKRSR